MRLSNQLHAWDVTPAQARAIQSRLADKVIREDDFENIQYVAGADIGFEDNNRTTRAAIAVLELPDLHEVETALARQPTRFPYVPGLLSFREVPAVLAALGNLHRQPDLILCDGQGYAHPRRFGLACHLGVLADLPTIGVGKTRLIGNYREPADVRGAWEPLIDSGETIGAVVRSRAGTKPIFVSIGHRISLATAVAYVMRCTGRYRLPETTRRAHRLASGSRKTD